MAKSPEEMAATMIANLKEKTGKTMAQWLTVTRKANLEKHGQIVKMLKSDYGVTHGFANLIAHETLGNIPKSSAGEDSDQLIESQYAGAKNHLRPIYDAVIDAVKKLGADVEIAPKKAYVSLRGKTQFALIQPTTKTRVDLGIKLKGVQPKGRLENSGSFNSMVTHRVRLESKSDVNTELKKWLKQAYEAC